jgi:hypothetical protein
MTTREPKELSPSEEAEQLIFKLRKRADLLLQAGDMKEHYWCLSEIARLQKSTGAVCGRERKPHARGDTSGSQCG